MNPPWPCGQTKCTSHERGYHKCRKRKIITRILPAMSTIAATTTKVRIAAPCRRSTSARSKSMSPANMAPAAIHSNAKNSALAVGVAGNPPEFYQPAGIVPSGFAFIQQIISHRLSSLPGALAMPAQGLWLKSLRPPHVFAPAGQYQRRYPQS